MRRLPWGRIRLVVVDIDGTLTDGTTEWAGPDVGWTQRYSVRDGEAILRLRLEGIDVVPLSRNKTRSARARMEGLGLSCQWLGVSDKNAALAQILSASDVSGADVLLVGDGEEDAALFSSVAIGCSVADARPSVCQQAHYCCRARGGERVMEELADRLLAARTATLGEHEGGGAVGQAGGAPEALARAAIEASGVRFRVALGIMSGTSADGVDAASIRLDPAVPGSATLLDHRFVPFPPALQEELRRPDQLSVARLSALHMILPQFFADAARTLRGRAEAVVCGCHGQTVLHAPPSTTRGSPDETAHTFQLGSSAALAALLDIAVVGDVRGADVALGGEGAPVAPIAHWFFLPEEKKPAWVVNLGGIANFTAVTHDLDQVISFDVGPGMMLSDAWARRSSAGREVCDRDGSQSRGGRCIEDVVDGVLAHPFFRRAHPKSTGREDFGHEFQEALFRSFSAHDPRDVAYSLLEATAVALSRAVQNMPDRQPPATIILSGGGARNPTLRDVLARHFPTSEVAAEARGLFAPSVLEAATMALIAARTQQGLPSSLPRVTGAREKAVLGHIHPAPASRTRTAAAVPLGRG